MFFPLQPFGPLMLEVNNGKRVPQRSLHRIPAGCPSRKIIDSDPCDSYETKSEMLSVTEEQRSELSKWVESRVVPAARFRNSADLAEGRPPGASRVGLHKLGLEPILYGKAKRSMLRLELN
jgi:hypothetical protein